MQTLSMALLVGACSAPVAFVVPVAVVGDGEVDVLLAHEVLPAISEDAPCRRASEPEHWALLCKSFGGALAQRAGHQPDFDNLQYVAVPLPPGTTLIGIVVSSEEGVDVITLDITTADGEATDVTTRACLLRMSRRSCQMAIIERDQQLGKERTVAVFSGL